MCSGKNIHMGLLTATAVYQCHFHWLMHITLLPDLTFNDSNSSCGHMWKTRAEMRSDISRRGVRVGGIQQDWLSRRRSSVPILRSSFRKAVLVGCAVCCGWRTCPHFANGKQCTYWHAWRSTDVNHRPLFRTCACYTYRKLVIGPSYSPQSRLQVLLCMLRNCRTLINTVRRCCCPRKHVCVK